ncbi:MAG TPA: pentapeptide repeat-containing protein, partial [Anaerolineae bacterium]|nr:pentapeptide repeat-containing protein [Anaerolineae bacterium]
MPVLMIMILIYFLMKNKEILQNTLSTISLTIKNKFFFLKVISLSTIITFFVIVLPFIPSNIYFLCLGMIYLVINLTGIVFIIHSQEKVRVIFYIFIAFAILISLYAYTLLHFWDTNHWIIINNTFGQLLALLIISLSPELLGICIGLVFIDELNNIRQEKQIKDELIRQARSKHNSIATTAITELKQRNWLKGIDLTEANLQECDFSFTNCQNTCFLWANLKNTNFIGANLSKVNLSATILIGADFNGAKLHEADFNGAKMEKVNLKHTKLTNATFENAVLIGADLSRTNLTGVNLQNTNCEGANFRRTDFLNPTG